MLHSSYVQTLIGIVIAIALIGGIGVFLYYDNTDISDKVVVDKEDLTDGSSGVSIDVEDDTEGGFTIEPFPIENIEVPGIPRPDLNQDVVFTESFPPEAKLIVEDKIDELKKALRDNPDLLVEWSDLAILYKQVGDYDAARKVWEFLGKISPANAVTFNNLGNLYHLYLKDFPKAEENFRIAIGNSPANSMGYLNLHELYKYSYKQDTTHAADVLKEGLVNIPNDINLLMALATYYRETKDNTNAKIYYEQTKVQAALLGNENLVSVINRMLELVSK